MAEDDRNRLCFYLTTIPIILLLGRTSHVRRVASLSRCGQRMAIHLNTSLTPVNRILLTNTVIKGKVAEIAAGFMTTFYHVQDGALETHEFRTTPAPFWLVCFSDTIKGPVREMYFVVLLRGRLLSRRWRSGCEGFTVWPFPGPLEKLLVLLLSKWKSNSLLHSFS
jgi:hypothetical protein